MLNASLLSKCARVPFGRYLCGRAALKGKIQFANCIDDRHETEYEGISPHGYYCIPIFSSDKKVLGVITLYLPEGREIEEIWVELSPEPISFFKNQPMETSGYWGNYQIRGPGNPFMPCSVKQEHRIYQLREKFQALA